MPSESNKRSRYVNRLERRTTEGDSPVTESESALAGHPSNVWHVKSGVNFGGPPSKAKYDILSDSEPVP